MPNTDNLAFPNNESCFRKLVVFIRFEVFVLATFDANMAERFNQILACF